MSGAFTWLVRRGLPLVPRPLVRRVAMRYVAGETLGDALKTLDRLAGEGAMATLDLLGEEVTERDKAVAVTDTYVGMLAAIAERGADANVSVKPTSLGLKIDEAFCHANIERIVLAAKQQGSFVRIDMEDVTTTDATLRMHRDLATRHGHVGVVLQAYLRRTLTDIDALPDDASVRLCKGIYIEAPQHAYRAYETVRANFLYALEKLIVRGVRVAIATHDEHLVCGALALLDRHAVPRERCEFQMLLGVTPDLRRTLLAAGHRLRVYVPFGRDWYPYSTRRLRENPEIAGHVLRAMLGRR
ncbi:MAG: proline dehydrogenase [Thermoanaerobaculia bacterium]|nr:MAG: proline dehydrogenase [Thermoanaerobaculia bacterium]MBZ0100700.1 proline dehydrogenase family protein [Thermoanaerobaculia bacterium]